MLDNCLFLLSPSEIKQEVCILLILISQRNVWYKVLVVGKNGKLNDTIEASALWSIRGDFSYGNSQKSTGCSFKTRTCHRLPYVTLKQISIPSRPV